MINILVTGVGSLLGQGIVRTIKKSRLNTNIVTTDYFNTAVGLYWGNKGYLLPDIIKKKNYKSWITNLIDICQNEKIDIVIPGLDFELPIFSKYKSLIERRTKSKILISSNKVIKIANDKWETIKFLKKNNFLYPESTLPNNIKKFIKKNKFPLIIKPRFGHTSKNIFIAYDYKELKNYLKKCTKPIIQEIIGDESNEYTCSSVYIGNKVLSTIALKRKLKNGNTSIAIHNKNEYLEKFIHNITKKLSPYGSTNYQLKLTKKGPVIFEINARFSGTTPLRAMFGINEIDIILNEIYNLKN